jgi:hypothetical protein
MTRTLAVTRALAVDIRERDTGVVLGVALVVPSERYVSFLADGARIATSHKLSAETWREIEAWAADGDAGLPARPAPLSPAVVSALLERDRLTVIAQRFASIPISVASHAELASLAERLLPELLGTR